MSPYHIISRPGRLGLAAALVLTGCGPAERATGLGPDGRTDPALLAALDDPILVDPSLSQFSNRIAPRSGDAPAGAAYPPGRGPDVAGCGDALRHDRGWAARLPPALAVPDGARLIDMAGADGAGCGVRVARFMVAAAPAAVLDRYWTKARRAGHSATQIARGPDQLLFGGNGARSYAVLAQPAAGGAEIGLVVREALPAPTGAAGRR